VIAYGAFLNNVIEFFIVAFTIFIIVRQINRWRGPAPKA
jgi:large conductance mechanosensitive channel